MSLTPSAGSRLPHLQLLPGHQVPAGRPGPDRRPAARAGRCTDAELQRRRRWRPAARAHVQVELDSNIGTSSRKIQTVSQDSGLELMIDCNFGNILNCDREIKLVKLVCNSAGVNEEELKQKNILYLVTSPPPVIISL